MSERIGESRVPGARSVDEGVRRPATEDGAAIQLLVGDGMSRLVLAGEVDHAANAELTEAVNEALDVGLPVQVDTRNVRFMDSSAIAMIAYLARRSDARLTMIQPPDVVRFLLEVTKIGDVVEITEHDPGFDCR